MSQVVITIELGNAEMRTPSDVAAVLDGFAATMLRDYEPIKDKAPGYSHTCRDLNGNTVASLEVVA